MLLVCSYRGWNSFTFLCHCETVHFRRGNLQSANNTLVHTKSTLLQRQIAATDRQIDALVYELFGLSDEEIRLVEVG